MVSGTQCDLFFKELICRRTILCMLRSSQPDCSFLVKNWSFLENVPLNAEAWGLRELHTQSEQGKVATWDVKNKPHPKYCVTSFCSWRLNGISTVFLGGRKSIVNLCSRPWYTFISAWFKLWGTVPLFAEIKLVYSVWTQLTSAENSPFLLFVVCWMSKQLSLPLLSAVRDVCVQEMQSKSLKDRFFSFVWVD